MLLELKLVLRSVVSRRRSLAKLTSAAAVCGLAAGVAALLIAQALARGFQAEMQVKLLAGTPHIAVFPDDGGDLDNWRVIATELATVENVRSVTGSAAESVFIVGPRTSEQAVLRTFEMPAGDGAVIRASVGSELARRAGIEAGSNVDIIVLRNGAETRRTQVSVTDVFSTGLFDYDAASIRVSVEDFARLYGDAEFVPRSLNISVNDIYRAGETSKLIREKTGGDLRVVDWQEANRPLFSALALEKRVAFAIILLLILIAALNITATLALLVNERRSDIAVLRTCGAKRRSLVLMFVLEGMLLGALGISAGLILGLAVCRIANAFHLISLPGEVYSIAYVPLAASLADAGLIAGVSLVLCLAATFYPALSASRIKPMENFRIR